MFFPWGGEMANRIFEWKGCRSIKLKEIFEPRHLKGTGWPLVLWLVVVGIGYASIGYCEMENQIGLYWDEDLSENCDPGFSNFPIFCNAFLTVANVNFQSICGWECCFGLDEGWEILGVEVNGESVNVGQFPNFIVGYSSPVVLQDDNIVLANVFLKIERSGGLYLDAVSSPSIPNASRPVLLVGEVSELVEANFQVGGYGFPNLTIGCECPPYNYDSGGGIVLIEDCSFSSIKAWFR